MDKAAFFDVDNTLIDMKSMFHFYHYWAEIKGYQERYENYMTNFEKNCRENVLRNILNRDYYQEFRGESLEELFKQGQNWFDYYFQKDPPFIQETIQRLTHHKAMGYKIVFISGSMLPLLQPLAKMLKAESILCTTLEVKDGKLTGEILPPQTIGDGKQIAMQQYADLYNINLTDSFAYGDDISDVPMLSVVGYPVCVAPSEALIKYAEKMSWEILPVEKLK